MQLYVATIEKQGHRITR